MERILIIDDETQLTSLYCEILREHGFHADFVSQGGEGLEYLAREPLPNLILLDFSMLDMSGEGFLRELRRRYPDVAARVRIVGFSSYAPGYTFPESFRSSVLAVIEKPLDADKIVRIVRQYLASIDRA